MKPTDLEIAQACRDGVRAALGLPITARASGRVERRTRTMRRGGRGGAGTRDDAIDFNLYGLQNLSTFNYLTSGVPGGEPGVSTGFLFGVLFVPQKTPSVTGILASRYSGTAGYQIYVDSLGDINAMASNAAGSAFVVAPTHRILASDVGKVMLALLYHDGTKVRLFVRRAEQGTGTATTGYTAAAVATQSGARAAAFPASDHAILGEMAAQGTPSTAQLQAYFDATRVLGDLPDTMGGATVTHLWSVKRELLGVTNPAGRKTYGARAFTASANFTGAASQGVRGSTGGFVAAISVRFDSMPSGAQLIMSCVDGTASTGWQLQNSGAVLRFILCPSTLASTYTLTASDLGRDLLILVHFTGSALRLYVGRAQVGTDVAGSFLATGSGDRFILGGGVSLPATAMSIFEMGGGNVNPSLATIQQCFDDFDRTGRIVPFAGLDHFYSLTTDIVANALAMPATLTDRIGTDTLTRGGTLEVAIDTATAPPCPLQLTDRVTASATDALARVGSPTVKVIDPTIDGRRTLGAQGFSAANYLTTANGIRGASTGFWVAVIARPDSAPSGTQYLCGTLSAVTNGWGFQYVPALRFGAYDSGGTFTGATTYTVPTADLGLPKMYLGHYTGSVLRLYGPDGTQVGADVALTTTGFGSSPFQIGTNAAPAQPATLSSVFAVMGGVGNPTLAEIQQVYADFARTGRLVAIPGKTDHLYDLTTDILASGVDAVPATVLDRVGSDHLTRVGIDVRTDANAIRGVGPYGVADGWQTAPGGGIQGSNNFAFVVDAWFTKVPTANEIFLQATPGSGTGYFLRATAAALNVTLLGVSGSSTYTLTSGDLNKRLRILFNKTATTQEFYILGTQVGTPQPATSYNANAATVVMQVGQFLGAQNFSSGNVEYVASFNRALTSGEIATLNADLTQRPPRIAGASTKEWVFEQDIAAVSGALPARSVERISGGDDMVRLGSPLTLAQRTERVWSYETAPIDYGANALTDTDYFSAVGAGVIGSAAGWWWAQPLIVESQAVASTNRVIAGNIVGSAGFTIQTGATNSTLSCYFYNGAGSLMSTAGLVVISASDVGKRLLYIVCWDGAKLHAYIKRAEIGTGTTAVGFTPVSSAQTFYLGRFSSAGANASGVQVLGGMGGLGVLSLAEVQAASDAYLARGDLVEVPGKTDFLQSMNLDARDNGGALPATLLDRKGGKNLTKTGNPNTAANYSRAAGW